MSTKYLLGLETNLGKIAEQERIQWTGNQLTTNSLIVKYWCEQHACSSILKNMPVYLDKQK